MADISAALRLLDARGPALLNQQCWLWGCDIKRSAGNLLLERGFGRTLPPDGEQGSRTYAWFAPKQTIVLWAFGIWYGEPGRGAVYLNRFACLPQYAAQDQPPAHVWRPDQLSMACPPADHTQRMAACTLAAALFGWIAAYERWVHTTAGAEYRAACVASWERGEYRIAADAIADEWQQLASAVAPDMNPSPATQYGGLGQE